MKTAVLVPANGMIQVANIDDSQELKQLQSLVGGMIEAVTMQNGDTMWVNEEGKLLGLPINSVATQWLLISRIGTGFDADIICGDVVLMGAVDEDGDVQSASPELIAMVNAAAEGAVIIIDQRGDRE
jgi:hypothetical protein